MNEFVVFLTAALSHLECQVLQPSLAKSLIVYRPEFFWDASHCSTFARR